MAKKGKGLAGTIGKHWPLVGAAGLGIVGLYLFAQQSAANTTAASGVANAPIDTSQAPVASGGGGIDPTAGGMLSTYLQYKAALDSNAAGAYNTYIGAGAYDFGQVMSAQVQEAQYEAAIRLAQVNKPSFLQQLGGFAQSIANVFAASHGLPSGGGTYSAYPSPSPGAWGSAPASTPPPNPFLVATGGH